MEKLGSFKPSFTFNILRVVKDLYKEISNFYPLPSPNDRVNSYARLQIFTEHAKSSEWSRALEHAWKQAGAELGQAQDKIKAKVGVGVKVPFKVGVGVEDEVNHFYTRWVLDVTKLILNSIQIEEVVEVRVELGKKIVFLGD